VLIGRETFFCHSCTIHETYADLSTRRFTDYILAYLYRSSGLQYGVAGLQPIENVKGVESMDVSDMVSGHTKYRLLTGPILQKIGFEDVDMEELEREQEELQEEEIREENERQESEKQEASGSANEVSDQHVEDLEKEVEKKNEQSYIGWAQSKMMAAGSSASGAYDKAKNQWFQRKEGGGQSTGTAGHSQPQAYEGT
jgi:hypothetical protein